MDGAYMPSRSANVFSWFLDFGSHAYIAIFREGLGWPLDETSWCCFPFRTFGGSGQLERRSNNVPASDASDQAFIRHYHMSVIFAGVHVEDRSGRLRCCTGRSRHATPSNSSHLARLMRLAIVVQNQDRLLLQKFVL